MPAGHAEAFHAALEGGADAVYLGMKEFNARERAFNFNPHQLKALLGIAGRQGVKVYVTLNTLIKNQELSQLLDTLHLLESLGPDAVIIQDWGVYHLAKKYFPRLNLHGSTQMGNHNSAGARFSNKKGFERIILARELRLEELHQISENTHIELEVFIHGALCYSFSGMCLFSSYLGGQSANRGLCKQPCRRQFQTDKGNTYPFNLKDNEQLEQLEEFKKMNIHSLKVEGRLKSAEYVWRVARAYRMALDAPERKKEAGELLKLDLGRPKTAYFAGGNLSEAFSKDTYTGKWLGTITETGQDYLRFSSTIDVNPGNRLRIKPLSAEEGKTLKVNSVKRINEQSLEIKADIPGEIKKGEHVYLTDLRNKKFPSKIDTSEVKLPGRIPAKKKSRILSDLKAKTGKKTQEQVFVRVDSINWLKKVHLPALSGLLLNLSRQEWENFRPEAGFLQKNRHKIYIELPKFIAEKHLEFYRALIRKLHQAGYQNYSLSHLSQKELFEQKAHFLANENIYAMNDASVKHYKQEEEIRDFIFPLENDWENLKNSNHKDGIVPVYFHPALFYSRMPVKAQSFTSDRQEKFSRISRDGITHIYPDKPVSLLQFTDKLRRQGYYRFLLDMSFEKPSGNRLETLLKRHRKSVQIQPATNFNFTKGVN